jgi:hypothetical protein
MCWHGFLLVRWLEEWCVSDRVNKWGEWGVLVLEHWQPYRQQNEGSFSRNTCTGEMSAMLLRIYGMRTMRMLIGKGH